MRFLLLTIPGGFSAAVLVHEITCSKPYKLLSPDLSPTARVAFIVGLLLVFAVGVVGTLHRHYLWPIASSLAGTVPFLLPLIRSYHLAATAPAATSEFTWSLAATTLASAITHTAVISLSAALIITALLLLVRRYGDGAE